MTKYRSFINPSKEELDMLAKEGYCLSSEEYIYVITKNYVDKRFEEKYDINWCTTWSKFGSTNVD